MRAFLSTMECVGPSAAAVAAVLLQSRRSSPQPKQALWWRLCISYCLADVLLVYLKMDINHTHTFIKPLCFLPLLFLCSVMFQMVSYRFCCAKVNVAQQWECYGLADQEFLFVKKINPQTKTSLFRMMFSVFDIHGFQNCLIFLLQKYNSWNFNYIFYL